MEPQMQKKERKMRKRERKKQNRKKKKQKKKKEKEAKEAKEKEKEEKKDRRRSIFSRMRSDKSFEREHPKSTTDKPRGGSRFSVLPDKGERSERDDSRRKTLSLYSASGGEDKAKSEYVSGKKTGSFEIESYPPNCDAAGTPRGSCKVCGEEDCPEFQRGDTKECLICGCLPAKHMNLKVRKVADDFNLSK
mmetsp:Transcript_40015/g.63247  ORF Transcript_40015/g.63247 Transcript_40015/m.63247 type:complete len:191 (+) Transcript_40015:1964-2536(+)